MSDQPATTAAKRKSKASEAKAKKKTCGLVMPISDHPDYPRGHWQDVQAMLSEAIEKAGCDRPKLVSDSNEVRVIHENIVRNLYDFDMIVCDVSSRNPNVMFELGMRLTFNKPVVIVTCPR